MIKKRIIFITAIGCMFLSCTRETKTEFTEQQQKILVADTIAVNEIMMPLDFSFKNGFLIATSYNTDNTIYLYKTPSLDFVAMEGRKGRGPREIPNYPIICRSPNPYLYVYGYKPDIIRKINLAENGEFQFLKDIEISDLISPNDMIIINDSIFIYNDIQELTVNKYDLINGKEAGKIEYKKEPHNEAFFYENRGIAAANESYLVYAHTYDKKIEIYDVNTFKLLKRISDGKSYPKPTVGEKESIVVQQYNVIMGKEKFYIIAPLYENGERSTENKCIEVFDFNGNSVIKYIIDRKVARFVVDEELGYIYGYVFGDDDFFLRYKI